MQINELSQGEFESMFGNSTTEATPAESAFSFKPTDSLFNNTKEEILNGKKEEIKDETIVTNETKPVEDEKVEDDTANPDDESSLFEGDKKASGEGDTKSTFDIKSYFSSRIKDGRFLPLEDEKLETEEDFDALIEANFEHKIGGLREDINRSWYDSKSGAWKFIAQHAEIFHDPKELLPILQGVETIERVASLNPKELADAERIVRLAKRGEPEKLVDQQITALKDNNTLVSVAEEYQPLLIQEENAKIAQTTYLKKQEEAANLQMVQNIHAKTVETLEKPFLGKYKLKRDEKSAVYDLVAEPQEDEGGGYKIFTAIDNLYENGDFDTLLEIGLILAKKEAHRTYLGISTGAHVAEGLMRKVKASTTSNTTAVQEDPAQVAAPKLKAPSKSGGSGFGFFSR